MFRKIWRFLVKPSSAFSVASLMGAGFFAGILFWGGFNWTIEATNSEQFCIVCHVMRDNPYEEFKGTVHHTNASGVGATCADCHVPREWLPKMVRKAHATKELYHYIVGTIDTPEKFEDRRLLMAQRVWDQMKANDSLECRNCHIVDRFDFNLMEPSVALQKQQGFARGETCIDCHRGIAHKLPDMSSGFVRLQRDLVTLAERQRGVGEVLYPITSINHYASAADAKAEGNAIGLVLPATRMVVLDRDGDAIQVRIKGWQQEGAERIVYAMRGKRIFEATLIPAMTDRVIAHGSETDPDTDLVWSQVSLDTWVRQGKVVNDIASLWAYAGEMYRATCSTCHSPRDAASHTANQWIGVMRGKQESVALESEQMRIVQKYLQLRARDVHAN